MERTFERLESFQFMVVLLIFGFIAAMAPSSGQIRAPDPIASATLLEPLQSAVVAVAAGEIVSPAIYSNRNAYAGFDTGDPKTNKNAFKIDSITGLDKGAKTKEVSGVSLATFAGGGTKLK